VERHSFAGTCTHKDQVAPSLAVRCCEIIVNKAQQDWVAMKRASYFAERTPP
jgi:hypothetical protein